MILLKTLPECYKSLKSLKKSSWAVNVPTTQYNNVFLLHSKRNGLVRHKEIQMFLPHILRFVPPLDSVIKLLGQSVQIWSPVWFL